MICTKCKEDKEPKYFTANKNLPGGREKQCRFCRKGYRTSDLDKIEKVKELFSKGLKECPDCKEVKDISNFNKTKSTRTGLSCYCKSCIAKKKAADPIKNKNQNLIKYFNITLNDYNKMLKDQDNKCKICKRDKDVFNKMLAVDHCHTTGKIRGLLCSNCNRALGHFKDNIKTLHNAITYLTLHNN